MIPWNSWRLPRPPFGFPKAGGVVFQGIHLRRLPGGQGVDLVVIGKSRERPEIQDPEEFVTMGPPKVKSIYS